LAHVGSEPSPLRLRLRVHPSGTRFGRAWLVRNRERLIEELEFHTLCTGQLTAAVGDRDGPADDAQAQRIDFKAATNSGRITHAPEPSVGSSDAAWA
jgi:hypothetical protein